MITAEQARENNENSRNYKLRKLVTEMENMIDTEIINTSKTSISSRVSIAFTSEMSMYQEEIFKEIKSKLEQPELGYKVEYIKGLPGDCYEPLDYGTPDCIKIRW